MIVGFQEREFIKKSLNKVSLGNSESNSYSLENLRLTKPNVFLIRLYIIFLGTS